MSRRSVLDEIPKPVVVALLRAGVGMEMIIAGSVTPRSTPQGDGEPAPA